MGERVARDASTNTHVVALLSLSTKTCFNIPQAFPVGQLSKAHTEKLVETTKGFDLVIPIVARHTTPKGVHGQMIHQLGKNKFPDVHVSPLQIAKRAL